MLDPKLIPAVVGSHIEAADMGSGELALWASCVGDGGPEATVYLDAEGVVALHSYLSAWLTYRRERLARDDLTAPNGHPPPR